MYWYTAFFWLTTLFCRLDYALFRKSRLFLRSRYKRQAIGSSETLMIIYKVTKYYKSEDDSLNFSNPVP